jgi:hypothetical protein
MTTMGAAKRTDRTTTWFAKADLRHYRGKFVALVDCRVAASGKDAKKVLAQARKRFPGREIVMWRVVDEDLLIL